MSIKLDDLLNEKKGPAPVLDLFKTSLCSRDGFEAALQKVPEYKIRPEKANDEEVTGEGPGGWRYHGGGRDEHPYTDPLPLTMRGLNMQDFYQVDIDWRMLTTARPQSRVEEEVFSRYVEMGRLQLATRKQAASTNSEQPWRTVKVVPGRGAVTEVRIAVCAECTDELCAGRCHDHLYNNYQRHEAEAKGKGGGTVAAGGGGDDDEDEENTTKKKKKKKKKLKKTKKKNTKVDEEIDRESSDD